MATGTMTSKGQITIPANVRERLGLSSGDRVEFVQISDHEFIMRPLVEDVRTLKGLLRKPARAVTTEQMRTAIRRRASE